MSDGGRAGLMEDIAQFSSCTRTELDLLSFIGTEMVVDDGTLVVEQHATGRTCFVIASGRARVTRDGELQCELGTGEFFGEMALLTGSEYPATVTADGQMELLVLTPAEFDALLAHAPSVVRKMLRARRPGVAV